MAMRRLPQVEAAAHSSNATATVGYAALDQKFAHGTVFAAHPWPVGPHSHRGAPAWTRLTWRCRWMPVDHPVVPAVPSTCPRVTVPPHVTPGPRVPP